jgi:pimeloyl-ACP methyl ester carboxylesterase
MTTLAPMAPMASEMANDLKGFFRSGDAGQPAEIAAEIASRITARPGYTREGIGEQLAGLDLWPAVPSGRRDLAVPVGHGQTRSVLLRVPRGYSPERSWPFLYLLHPGGSSGVAFLSYAEQLLGPKIEEYIVAAPTGYRQTGLDAPAPFTVDHLAIFAAVRRTVHVDPDRTFALGYSTGGYAAWAVALFHADQLAGAVAIGSVFTVPPGEDGLWKTVLPNLARVPVMHVWGTRDTMPVIGIGTTHAIGTMAEVNQRFRTWTQGMRLPIEDCAVPGCGHGGLHPPEASLRELLKKRRVHFPPQVDHTFRHVHQGHCYWLEAHTWEGEHWGAGFPRVQKQGTENDARALGRTVGALLGKLSGEVCGQTIRVERRHVGELTVWVGEGMIDWERPVAIEVDGREVFAATLRPDLAVCLAQAARSFDFARLRWAGVRVGARLDAEPVTVHTPFPPLLPASPESRSDRSDRGRPRPPRRRG